jgi:hypothetical protein
MITDDQARPAASLTAERIKRGAVPTVIEATPQHDAEAALRREAREFAAVNAENDVVGIVGVVGAESGFRSAEGFLNWRRAGVFGLIYLGALAAFAAAFDVLP